MKSMCLPHLYLFNLLKFSREQHLFDHSKVQKSKVKNSESLKLKDGCKAVDRFAILLLKEQDLDGVGKEPLGEGEGSTGERRLAETWLGWDLGCSHPCDDCRLRVRDGHRG